MVSSPATTIATDVVIVGAGPVGLFQAFQLGVLGISSQIIDALPAPGGQCLALYPDKPIYDIPGQPVLTGRQLTAQLLQQLSPFTQPQAGSPVAQALGFYLDQVVTEVSVHPSQASLGDASPPRFKVITSHGCAFDCSAVVVAAGVGAFLPRKPVLEGLPALEGQQVFYHWPLQPLPRVPLPPYPNVVVQGDSDQALTAAIALALADESSPCHPQSVTLLHRRDAFSASDTLVSQLLALRESRKINFVAGQANSLVTPNGNLRALEVTLTDGTHQQLPSDLYLPLLGLSPQLGPLQKWGYALAKKSWPVDPATCQTEQAHLYAVGDINHYPGKRKLIVSGFHEATVAAYAIAEQLQGQRIAVQYTTANRQMHERLGVSLPP